MGEVADESDPIRNCHMVLIRCREHPTFATATKLRCHRCDWVAGLDCDYCHGDGHTWIMSPGGWRIFPVWSAPLENFFEFRAIVAAHDIASARESFPAGRSAPVQSAAQNLLSGLIKAPEPVIIKRRI